MLVKNYFRKRSFALNGLLVRYVLSAGAYIIQLHALWVAYHDVDKETLRKENSGRAKGFQSCIRKARCSSYLSKSFSSSAFEVEIELIRGAIGVLPVRWR